MPHHLSKKLNLLQISFGELIVSETIKAEIKHIHFLKNASETVIPPGCRISNKLYNTALKSCNEL